MSAPAFGISWCLLLLLVAGSRQLSITEFVVPSAIEAGSDAELQCRFSEGESVEYVKWWWTPLYLPSDDRNRRILYQHLTNLEGEPSRKNVEGKENDTIVLLNLKSTDSGRYECEVYGTQEVRMHQDLIVFSNGTDLVLNVTQVEDGADEDEDYDVLVQCEALDVTPAPELSISINGKEIPNLEVNVFGDSNGLFNVTVNATISDDAAEGAEIRCELFYQDRNISHPPYAKTIIFTSGAGWSTTEMPEDTTHSEVASELQNTSGVIDVHASLWILLAASVIQLYGIN